MVWLDRNGDGVRDEGEPGLPDAVIHVSANSEVTRSVTTPEDGIYYFAFLSPGTYRVREENPPRTRFSSTPNEAIVGLASNTEAVVDFGDWNGWPHWLPMILHE